MDSNKIVTLINNLSSMTHRERIAFEDAEILAEAADTIAFLLERSIIAENKLILLEEKTEKKKQKNDFHSKVIKIVNICFPKFQWNTKPKPPVHPGKPDWNNGVNLVSYTEKETGNGIPYISAYVTSYLGQGETDDYSLHIPQSWLDLDDPTETIHEWIKEETSRLLHKKKQDEVTSIRENISSQQRYLDMLLAQDADAFSLDDEWVLNNGVKIYRDDDCQ